MKAIVAGCMCAGMIASAAPLNAATFFNTVASDLPGIGAEFDADRCFEFNAGAASTAQCGQIRFYENTRGTIDDVAFGSFASTSEGQLKASAFVSKSSGTSAQTPNGETVFQGQDQLAANSLANFRDSVTLGGGTVGTQGTLRLSFALDGRTQTQGEQLNPSQPFFGASASAAISIFETAESFQDNTNTNISQQGTFTSYFDFLNESTTYDEVVDLELDFTYGSVLHFGVTLQANARINNVNIREGSIFALSDFASTATLIGLDAFDGNGEQIDQLTLTSVSGSNLLDELVTARNSAVSNNGSNVAPVPLPATGWMLIAGVGGIAFMRRLKKA